MGSVENNKLALVEQSGIPAPVFSGSQMTAALKGYKELQADLDKAMPDQLMVIGDKSFRKKGYWRALSTAFNLSVEPVTLVQEERSVIGQLPDGTDNYVYTVTYKASTPSGRFITGDGTCAASEKQKGRMDATEHNVRSHAHTRAFNRAVSNIVGFGEVSAEEVDRSEHDAGHASTQRQTSAPVASTGSGEPVMLTVKTVYKHSPAADGKKAKPGKVILSDGREGTTFDGKLIEKAEEAKSGGWPVDAKFEEVPSKTGGKPYVNLVGLERYVPPEPTLPLVVLPLGKPEEIETVREMNPSGGAKYWTITTLTIPGDKDSARQYVTTTQAHAVFCETCKNLKQHVVVEFKVIKGKNGGEFNEIVKLDEEVAGVKDAELVGAGK